jgi:predicted Fe-Mo cluster-binding NifX family protein
VRIAIPLFGQDVSPRFGCCRQFMIADVEQNQLKHTEVIDTTYLAPWQLPEFLTEQRVSRVICGGIHRQFQSQIENRNIEVIWGVIGPAQEALNASLAGKLRSDQFVCPGRWGAPRRRRRRRGGR